MTEVAEVGIRFSSVDFVKFNVAITGQRKRSVVVKASEIYSVEFSPDGTAVMFLKSGAIYFIEATEKTFYDTVFSVSVLED